MEDHQDKQDRPRAGKYLPQGEPVDDQEPELSRAPRGEQPGEGRSEYQEDRDWGNEVVEVHEGVDARVHLVDHRLRDTRHADAGDEAANDKHQQVLLKPIDGLCEGASPARLDAGPYP